MIDHEVNRHQRVDLLAVATKPGDAVTHSREVDHCWHACEVLEDHTTRLERDIDAGCVELLPVQNLLDIALLDLPRDGKAVTPRFFRPEGRPRSSRVDDFILTVSSKGRRVAPRQVCGEGGGADLEFVAIPEGGLEENANRIGKLLCHADTM